MRILVVASLLFAACSSNPGVSGPNTLTQAMMGQNDAPVLNAARSPVLAAQTQNAPAPSGAVGSLVSEIVDYDTPAGGLDNVTDADVAESEASSLGAALTDADTTNGSWHFSLDDGVTWNALGAVANNNARLLPAGARLYFQPNNGFTGTIATAITFRAWDGTEGTTGALANTNPNGGTNGYSNATDTASLTVNPLPDTAPVLDAAQTPTIAPVLVNAPAPTGAVGSLVSTLVSYATNVTDPDAGPGLGIAVTAADTTNGAWSFSTDDGATWTALGAVTNVNARLLTTTARLYFQPNAAFTGTATITFRAWDTSSGTNGTLASTATNGGLTAFSLATDTAAITVTTSAAPQATNLSAAETFTEDMPLDLTNIVVSDTDSTDVTVTLTLSNASAGTLSTGTSNAVTSMFAAGVWTAQGAIVDVNALLAAVTFSPAQDFATAFNLTTSVTDGATPAITGAKPFTPTPVNDAPTLSAPDTARTDIDTPVGITGITAADIDSASLTITLSVADGTLTLGGITGLVFASGDGADDPSMAFDGSQANINGALAGLIYTPPMTFEDVTTLSFTVSDGTPVTKDIAITVGNPPLPPDATNANALETFTEDTPLELADITVSDPDSAMLTVTLTLSNPAAGTLSTGTSNAVSSSFANGVWSASGAVADLNTLLAAIVFTPAPNFAASFSLTVLVSDGALSFMAAKGVTAVPVNDAPVAVDDAATVDAGGDVTIAPASNDTDVDNSIVGSTLTIVTSAAHGQLTLNADGSVAYRHDGGGDTTDTFTYSVKDFVGATSNVGTVTITITQPDGTTPDPDNGSKRGCSCASQSPFDTGALALFVMLALFEKRFLNRKRHARGQRPA